MVWGGLFIIAAVKHGVDYLRQPPPGEKLGPGEEGAKSSGISLLNAKTWGRGGK